MDLKELKKLTEILKENEVTEFEMEREGVKIKMSRGALINMQPIQIPGDFSRQPIPAAELTANTHITNGYPVVANPVTAVTAPDMVAPPKEEPDIMSQDGIHIVNSPIVGTFYRKPNPKADPYVEIGSAVKEGQVLCIVEAMKLMNEITADKGGEVVKIFVEDAQPVEYGEPLFALKTK